MRCSCHSGSNWAFVFAASLLEDFQTLGVDSSSESASEADTGRTYHTSFTVTETKSRKKAWVMGPIWKMYNRCVTRNGSSSEFFQGQRLQNHQGKSHHEVPNPTGPWKQSWKDRFQIAQWSFLKASCIREYLQKFVENEIKKMKNVFWCQNTLKSMHGFSKTCIFYKLLEDPLYAPCKAVSMQPLMGSLWSLLWYSC